MANEAQKLGAAIHHSTGYVFAGTKTVPGAKNDPACPINVCGSTELVGEQVIKATGISCLILLASLVYSLRDKNLLLITVLRQAQEGNELRIVSDQYSALTRCRTIAGPNAQIANLQKKHQCLKWWPAERQ